MTQRSMQRRALAGALVMVLAAGSAAVVGACADDRATFAVPDEAGPVVSLPDASPSSGDAATDADAAPPLVDIGTDITCGSGPCMASLAVGRAHACARTKDGDVYCWGTDELGQLGRGARADGGKDAPIVDCVGDSGVAVTGPFRDAGVAPPFAAKPARVDVHASSLSASAETTCVTTTGKTVECWGADQATYAFDVDGLLRSSNAVPRRVGCLPEVSSLAVGTLVTCGVVTDGSLRCWGTLSLQNLGAFFPDCPFLEYCPPTAFALEDHFAFSAVSQRGGAFLGLTTMGELVSWGSTDIYYTLPETPGTQYPLGLTGRLTSFAPRDVVALPKVTSMSVGYEHACVVSDGRVMCWGMNVSGVIGRNSAAGKRIYPLPVEALLPEGTRATSVSVNDHNSCARLTDGRVYCWGDDSHGQLGAPGAGGESAEPLEVVGLPAPAVDVAVMADSVCALLKNGSVACWGSHAAGQLGDPTVAVGPDPHPVPVVVSF